MSTLQHDSCNPTVDLYKQLAHYLLVISWGYFCAQHDINIFVRLKAAEIKIESRFQSLKLGLLQPRFTSVIPSAAKPVEKLSHFL
jgi:hypothetical protein